MYFCQLLCHLPPKSSPAPLFRTPSVDATTFNIYVGHFRPVIIGPKRPKVPTRTASAYMQSGFPPRNFSPT